MVCLDVGTFAKKQTERLTKCLLDEAATMKEGSPRREIDLQEEVGTGNYG